MKDKIGGFEAYEFILQHPFYNRSYVKKWSTRIP